MKYIMFEEDFGQTINKNGGAIRLVIEKELILEENKAYWTNRTLGYSKVNEEELHTTQKEKWLKAIKENVPSNTRKILDIGTGPGFFAIILAEAGYEVTALDCTQSMLERAKVNAGDLAEKINWVLSDAQNLNLETEQYDAIVSRNLTWNLPNPKVAYSEWIRVLKKGGILLNFDANWYRYLYSEEERRGYESDRKRVEELQLEDHYTCTDIDTMENIAKKLPLSKSKRPEWDINILRHMQVTNIEADMNVWQRVWSETEIANYYSTPMFMIKIQK